MAAVLDFDEIHKLGNELADAHLDNDSLISIVSSSLFSQYGQGVEAAGEMLYASTYLLIAEMYASVYKPTGGKTFAERLKEDGRNIVRILETEAHRVWHEGLLDGARKTNLPHIYKVWITKQDPRVRETHEYIHAVRLPLGDRFVTFDGDSALAPGGFSLAENNVNCRCVLRLERG